MKTLKIFLPFVLPLLFLLSSSAQTENDIDENVTARDTAWKAGGVINFTFSQAAFSNWAAGGENSYSLYGRFIGFVN